MKKTKTILVVDDSESIREAVSLMLISNGFDVKKANDGMDAMRHFTGHPIHLVITDLHMPNRDGISLTREIRKMENYARIPILMLTTESQASIKMEAKKAGATGWIVKPCMADKLMSVVNKVLR
jgi:two-component system, chemotaxis family, chemotaxis protein CheY